MREKAFHKMFRLFDGDRKENSRTCRALHIRKHGRYKVYVNSLRWALILAAPIWLCSLLVAQSTISVTAHPELTGVPIPPEFVGLSFETSVLLPGANGKYHFFRANNGDLIRLFKTLGVKSLRIGGSSADKPNIKSPTNADIDELYHFAAAANVKVMYTLRLLNSSPAAAATTAKYVMEHYGSQTDCIAIGNEPSTLKVYHNVYSQYQDDIRRYMQVLTRTVPSVNICGPNGGTAAWAANYAKEFASSGHIRWVTQHSYPGGNGGKITDPAAARLRMFSPSFTKSNENLYRAFVPEVKATGLRYRIGEANSFYDGGARNVSNTFASALWGLDYLYWWASHHSMGVNFHTGDTVSSDQPRCWYAVFWTSPDGYNAHPLAYAMKAFDLTNKGTIIPVTISPKTNYLRAYSVLTRNKALYITLINNKAQRGSATIEIHVPSGYGSIESMTLSAPGNNLAATSGVTLGGASITSDGKWSGKWDKIKSNQRPGQLRLTLQSASAEIIRLTPR